MDNIKRLEEIGLKRVSEETHIEQKYIKYMVDGNFDKLNRINTLGFVKILSREYNINLDNWVAAFEEYWQQNRIVDNDEEIFIVAQGEKKSKKIYIVMLLMVFLAIVFFMFSIFGQNFTSKEQPVSFTENTTIIEEVNNSLEELEKDVQIPEELKTETVVAEMPNDQSTQEINQEEPKELSTVTLEANVTVQDDNPIDTVETPQTEIQSETFSNEAVIHPKNELWIGVIYLDTFSRRSFLGEGNFSIDLSRDQIITTGHGSFSLKAEQGDLDFSRQSPIRFEVSQGNIKEISWSRFKELNKGNSW
jgi:cytoskeletal protein RodZ